MYDIHPPQVWWPHYLWTAVCTSADAGVKSTKEINNIWFIINSMHCSPVPVDFVTVLEVQWCSAHKKTLWFEMMLVNLGSNALVVVSGSYSKPWASNIFGQRGWMFSYDIIWTCRVSSSRTVCVKLGTIFHPSNRKQWSCLPRLCHSVSSTCEIQQEALPPQHRPDNFGWWSRSGCPWVVDFQPQIQKGYSRQADDVVKGGTHIVESEKASPALNIRQFKNN